MLGISSDNEKRRFRRVPFIYSASLSLDKQCWQCLLLDISLKGLLLEVPVEFNITKEALYSVNLMLSEEIAINMQAEIVHAESNHLGLQWVTIDLDSLATLRRLLEFNLSDPQEINRELANLIS